MKDKIFFYKGKQVIIHKEVIFKNVIPGDFWIYFYVDRYKGLDNVLFPAYKKDLKENKDGLHKTV